MADLNQPIREAFFFGDYFWEFYNDQPKKVQDKILWTIRLVTHIRVVPSDYLKHLEGTDLYEIRISSGSNIFRIFCFFDDGNLVILLNAFQKKTQKTPKKEIDKALKLKQDYYEQKQ